ncbi:matrilin-2 [Lingula anatina]|uniref:Matrilin-2 n=1 Tax=Lingula anatina TaxID=7574 RepID=A0A2R2MI81_LINAN|nr:matrilin-2 [Lingula anatina]|eukprot:XP_023929921.1 matrilin-2 [Lingula anatina]
MGRLWRLAVLGLAFVMLDELGYGKCNAALDRDTYAEVVCGITDKGIVWRSFHSCAAAGMGVPTVSTFFRNGCKDLVIKSLPDVAKAKHLACKILEKMANECVSLYGANVSDWRVETGCTLTTPPLTTPKTATPTPISTTIKALSTAKPSECGKDVKADVLFVIDESRSVGPINFEKVKKFLADLVLQLPVAQDKIRVGVLSFTQIVHPRISLNEFDKPRDVADAILNMSYHGRRTNIAAALWYAQQTSFSKASGDRSTAPNLLFLFTDGRSRQRQISAAANATKAGIEIFTIGIGSNVSIPQITQLASEPKIDHVFTVAGFDALATIKSTLGAKFCAVKAKKCDSDKEYQTNVTECQPTCPGAPQNCGDPTKMVPESCVCKPGTILDGTDCIKPASCVPKCWDNGNAYQVGDQLLIDNCKTEITCNLVNGKASLSKKAVSCSPPPSAECKTANGTRQCVCLPGYTGDGYTCLLV